MRMAERGKVIIQAALNETHYKDKNPNIPYGPSEVIPQAIECVEAGAAIVHFHNRTDDGRPSWSDEDIYLETVDGIKEKVDVITLPSFTPDHNSTCRALELVPIENGTANMVGWDSKNQKLVQLAILDGIGSTPSEASEETTKAKNVEMLQHLPSELSAAYKAVREKGLQPILTAFEIGWLRHGICAWRAGELPDPLLINIHLFDQILLGPSATPAGLDAYINELPPELNCEVTVVPYLMDDREGVEALLRHALKNGHNIRVGIGDSPSAFPTETNAKVVRWAVDIAAEYGRVPATVDEVRHRFAMAVSPA